MTQFEMAENISEKCNVTLEEARDALEAGDWNMLTAAQQIEVEKVRRMQEIDEAVSDCGTAAAQAPEEEPAAEQQAATIETPAEAPRTESRKRSGGKGLKNVGDHIRRLVACGNRNRFVVRRGDATMLELPVTVLALLMLCAFWVCVPLLVIGLFAGCRYSFSGRDLGRDSINSTLGKASEAAEHVKRAVARA